MNSTRKRTLAAVLLVATGTALLLLRDGGEPPRQTGTDRMRARLKEIAENADFLSNPFLNAQRAKWLESMIASRDFERMRTELKQAEPLNNVVPNEMGFLGLILEDPSGPSGLTMMRRLLAREMLLAGRTQEAISEFEAVRSSFEIQRMPPPEILQLDPLLALSYLRLGEQDNCVRHHGIDSCLLPIRGSGVHSIRTGSESAVREYSAQLRRSKENLAQRWLLNIAYMTLGEHPDSVPKEWLIPAEAFAAEREMPRFPDVASQLGLDTVGLAGGVVMDDLTGNGAMNLLTSSWGLEDPLQFFQRQVDGTYLNCASQANLDGLFGGLNLCQVDYNNDGFLDILVLRGAWLGKDGRHPNSLLRNNGDGTFEDVTEEADLLSLHPTQTASWADFDNDGCLDLFIGNESWLEDSWTDIHPCELYHNNGDGSFEQCAERLGLAIEGMVKAVVWGDYNNDGRQDLFISRYGEPNLLLRNDGPPRQPTERFEWVFQDVSEAAGIAEPVRSFPAWFWDYDNDGALDIFAAGYDFQVAGRVAGEYLLGVPSASLPRLYHNEGDGKFQDVTEQAGLRRVLPAMGVNYGDLDNDGFLDCYIGTGAPDFEAIIPNRMFRNNGEGLFEDVTSSAGFGHLQKGHGIAFGDIDNDGDQDVYAVMGGAYSGDVFHNALFENPGNDNHWVVLRLVGTSSNRWAVGARIEVSVDRAGGQRSIFVTVSSGGSFGASSLQQEIGLGDAAAIRSVSISWPSGLKTTLANPGMDRVIRVKEPRQR